MSGLEQLKSMHDMLERGPFKGLTFLDAFYGCISPYCNEDSWLIDFSNPNDDSWRIHMNTVKELKLDPVSLFGTNEEVLYADYQGIMNILERLAASMRLMVDL